jgi:hypothetical protein
MTFYDYGLVSIREAMHKNSVHNDEINYEEDPDIAFLLGGLYVLETIVKYYEGEPDYKLGKILETLAKDIYPIENVPIFDDEGFSHYSKPTKGLEEIIEDYYSDKKSIKFSI